MLGEGDAAASEYRELCQHGIRFLLDAHADRISAPGQLPGRPRIESGFVWVLDGPGGAVAGELGACFTTEESESGDEDEEQKATQPYVPKHRA